jgi:hypothetical protein
MAIGVCLLVGMHSFATDKYFVYLGSIIRDPRSITSEYSS